MAAILWIRRSSDAAVPPTLRSEKDQMLHWHRDERRLVDDAGQELSDEELIEELDRASLVVCW